MTAPKRRGSGFLLAAIPIIAVLVLTGRSLYRQSLSAPLLKAIERHDPDAVAHLLQRGAPPNATDGLGDSALSLALYAPMTAPRPPGARTATPAWREKIAGLLLRAGADANEITFGKPALYYALSDQSPALVEALLAHGASPNAVFEGDTALGRTVDQEAQMHAAGSEDAPLLTLALLAGGADARRPGLPLLMAAVRSDSGYLPPYHGGDPALLEALLAHGAEVDGRGPRGQTALWTAADRGEPEDVRVLLAHGAAPGLADNDDRTPLQAAREGEARELALLNAEGRAASKAAAHPPGAQNGADGAPGGGQAGSRRPETQTSIRARYAAVEALLNGASAGTK
jgi:ankyrin repeat protein